jgi:benzoylformate decarboxylase
LSKDVLKDMDLLIGIGCPMFGQGFFNPEPTLPKGLKIIQIDENPWEIGKNMPVNCGIQGNIKSVLEELNASLAEKWSFEMKDAAIARAREIAEEKKRINRGIEKRIEEEKDRIPISVTALMAALREAMTADTVIVDDCWSSSGMLRQILDLSGPKQFFRSRRGGSIGWGLPGALGVRLGMPEKPVVVVSGDGSAAWSMQSLWTAARYRIPVTFVIINNATYRQVKLVRKIVLGDYPLIEKHDGMDLDKPVVNFSMLAQAMGVKGEQVERPEELAPVIKSSIHSEEPRLIEVFVENRSES